jgi:electron transport complex protein RnfB
MIIQLSQLLGRPAKALGESFGLSVPPVVAVVDEETCIGCAKCLDACPVDAILGAAKFTHAVIENQCIGCELCLPACPVDCITVTESISQLDTLQRSERALSRYQARDKRLERRKRERSDKLKRQIDDIGPVCQIDTEALMQLKQRVKNKKSKNNT